MVVLEESEHAKTRGAHIYGEILGYGSTADAYRITDIHPEGRGAIGCMQMAIADAGSNPTDIDYINAHGTSTTVNDKVETLACRRSVRRARRQSPVSSTKSMMGHLIAAAGVTELIVCLMAIRDDVLPPTINYENPDPDCDLDYVPNEAREATLRRRPEQQLRLRRPEHHARRGPPSRLPPPSWTPSHPAAAPSPRGLWYRHPFRSSVSLRRSGEANRQGTRAREVWT